MLEYVCLYRKYYPADSRKDVWCHIAMQEGYAMIAGAMSHDGFLQFCGVEIADGGYIGEELKKLSKMIQDKTPKPDK